MVTVYVKCIRVESGKGTCAVSVRTHHATGLGMCLPPLWPLSFISPIHFINNNNNEYNRILQFEIIFDSIICLTQMHIQVFMPVF